MDKIFTQWYPSYVKPVRKGVYQISPFFGIKWFRLWDGKKWHWGARTPKNAGLGHHTIAMQPDEFWRGIAK